MLTTPKTQSPAMTVAQARRLFADDHVHACLVVTSALRLLAVVEREDLGDDVADADAGVGYGELDGRVVRPDAVLAGAYRGMLAAGRRRLAVVDEDGRLVGLLCLKRTGTGFCSDLDVAERAAQTGRPLPGRLSARGILSPVVSDGDGPVRACGDRAGYSVQADRLGHRDYE
jgi:CBS domain-containing protein